MGRLVVIVIALALLAFADVRYDDEALTVQRQSSAGSDRLAEPAAPEPGVPAIVTAAVSSSATVQTVLAIESGRQPGPAFSVSTVNPHLPVVARSTARLRFFPLLI